MAIILVVDDEVGIRELLSEILVDEGYDIRLAENAETAQHLRETLRPDLVLLDIWMPGMDGISLLKSWHAGGQLTMPVVMMSGHGTIDTAVEATRFGAFDFLEKPIALQKLLATVQKALKHDVPQRHPPLTLDAFGRSGFIREFRRRLEQTAAKSPMLLLKGVCGGVAEICARTLQPPQAPWRDLSTVTSVISQDYLQGATGGLLFVPDLASLGKLQQMNLAFALERLEKFNLQLVAASSRSLATLAESGWDSKLLGRIGEVWITAPALAGHAEEVPEIATQFLSHFVARGEVPLRRFSSGALNALRNLPWKNHQDHSWGDLYVLVRNIALNALEEEIAAEDVERILPAEPEETDVNALAPLFELSLREARDAFEKHYFEHLLRLEGGSMTRVAERSGLERTHLYRKLKQLGVELVRRHDA